MGRTRRVVQDADFRGRGWPRYGDSDALPAYDDGDYELFLDYGIRIKARSLAVQTFLVQLTANSGWEGTYLPAERSVGGKGYAGSVYD